MDKSKQPGINFMGVLITSETFKRAKVIPADTKLDINFKMNHLKPQDGNIHNMEIITKISGKSEDIEVWTLETVHIGVFSPAEEENLSIDTFMTKISASYVFPYIREHVATISQKAGLSPVLLQPINLLALCNIDETTVKDSDENKKD